MKIKITFLLALFCLASAGLRLRAQSKSFKDALEIKLLTAGPVYAKDQVKGYFFFYELGSAGGGKKKYLTRLLDQNLNLVLEKEMEDKMGVSLKEAAFSENVVVFKFLHLSKQEVQLVGISKQGEEKFRKTTSMYLIPSGSSSDFPFAVLANRGKTLYGIDSLGFLDFTMDNTGGYFISFFSTSETLKDWTFTPKPSEMESSEFLALKGDTIFAAVFRGKDSWPLKGFVLAIDLKTGKQLFEKEFTEGTTSVAPLNFAVSSSGQLPTLVGKYYHKKAVSKPVDDMGLFLARVGNDGSLYDKKNLSFRSGAFFDLLPKKENGKLRELTIHNIFQTSKGELFVLFETNARLDSAGWWRVNELGLLRLNEKFEPVDIQYFGKKKHGGGLIYSMPDYSGFGDWNQNSFLVDLGYDYRFTVREKSSSNFIIGFLADKAELKGRMLKEPKKVGDSKWEFGAGIFLENDFVTDRLEFDSGADDVFVFPAKFGYVAIAEYFKEEKRLDLRLEKINY